MPDIVPLRRSALRRPLPSTGSLRVGSPASPVLRDAPIPCRPSRRTSLPSLGGTELRSLVRSRRRPNATAAGQGLWINRLAPRSGLVRRRQGLPGSWGTPCVHALLSDPGGDLCARPSRRFSAAFRYFHHVGSHDHPLRGSITRPAHSLSTLRRYGHPQPRKTRFRLLASFAGRDCLPAGFHRKVSERLHLFLPTQASPGAQKSGRGGEVRPYDDPSEVVRGAVLFIM